MTRSTCAILLLIALAAANTGWFPAVSAAGGEEVEKLIIAREKAALDVWGRGDPSRYIELATGDITYFDPSLGKRLDGRKAFIDYLLPLKGTFSIYRFEMIGPSVQVTGNTAILTFNLLNYDRQGAVTSRWNSTEVYRLTDGEWKICHSHWSYIQPKQQEKG